MLSMKPQDMLFENTTSDGEEEPKFDTQRQLVFSISLNVILFFFIAFTSAVVHWKNLLAQVKNRAIIIGLVLQFLVTPLVGLLVVSLVELEDAEEIILMVILSSPGGAFSNMLCSLFNADAGLSVAMSAVSTLACLGFLPLNVFLYIKLPRDAEVELSFLDLLFTIIAVEAGVMAGVLLNKTFHGPRAAGCFLFLSAAFSTGILLVTISLSQTEEKISEKSAEFKFACFLPQLILSIIAVTVTSAFGLPKPERLAITVEIIYQNAAIASPIAFLSFPEPIAKQALGVPVLNGLFQFTTAVILLVVGWKAGWSYAPKDESFFKIIAKNYQPLIATDDPTKENKKQRGTDDNTTNP